MLKDLHKALILNFEVFDLLGPSERLLQHNSTVKAALHDNGLGMYQPLLLGISSYAPARSPRARPFPVRVPAMQLASGLGRVALQCRAHRAQLRAYLFEAVQLVFHVVHLY